MCERQEGEVPQEVREQFKYDPVYCHECELPVSLTKNPDDQQPMRFECSCMARSPASAFPDRWSL